MAIGDRISGAIDRVQDARANFTPPRVDVGDYVSLPAVTVRHEVAADTGLTATVKDAVGAAQEGFRALPGWVKIGTSFIAATAAFKVGKKALAAIRRW